MQVYAIVGCFATKPNPDKGLRVFRYDVENGALTYLYQIRPDLNVGQTLWDEGRQRLYLVHEAKGPGAEVCGGGLVCSACFDHETGRLQVTDEKETHATLPCYLSCTPSGNYIMVAHHGTRNVITKTERMSDGTWRACVVCDEVPVSLMRICEDGTLGELCDVCGHEPIRDSDGVMIEKIPHLHSVVCSPDGRLWFACDKGLDAVHRYRVDESRGVIRYLGKMYVDDGVHPRYGKFHPTLPVYYQDCENSLYLYVWNYDSISGAMDLLQKVPLVADEACAAVYKQESAADLIVTPDGRFVYVSIRGLNLLAVLSVGEDGRLSFMQNIPCGGTNPRGLALSPDGRMVLVMNRDSGNIVTFRRTEEGLLEYTGQEIPCNMPANLQFIIDKI